MQKQLLQLEARLQDAAAAREHLEKQHAMGAVPCVLMLVVLPDGCYHCDGVA